MKKWEYIAKERKGKKKKNPGEKNPNEKELSNLPDKELKKWP